MIVEYRQGFFAGGFHFTAIDFCCPEAYALGKPQAPVRWDGGRLILPDPDLQITNRLELCDMTENEKELIQMIRESDDPAKAFIIALDIICKYIQPTGNTTQA